jgi:broad specificity phosphatase PhoE
MVGDELSNVALVPQGIGRLSATRTISMRSMIETVRDLLAYPKGLLAMDESNATCDKRFAAAGIPQTEWNIYRDGCPNGEAPDEIGARVDRLIARLRDLGGDIALFAHGQLGGVFAARWIGLPPAQGRHFSLGPASLGVLSWDRDHLETPVVALWNAAPGVPA